MNRSNVRPRVGSKMEATGRLPENCSNKMFPGNLFSECRFLFLPHYQCGSFSRFSHKRNQRYLIAILRLENQILTMKILR